MPSFWDKVAPLPGLSPVTDYQAAESPWARYVTALHLGALERDADLRPTDTVLDYGCGVGRIAFWLAPRVARVIGVDTSGPMIEEARRRCPWPNVELAQIGELVRSDAHAPPLPEVDAVTCVWVLQHVLDEDLFGATISALARALRPGASLYTIDRLSRETVDHGESDYLALRRREDYEQTFARHGLEQVASHPVSVGEQVLGRPGLTRLVRRVDSAGRVLARVDLAWARRQRDPLLADWFFRFQRPA